jgi:hypothetical protein
MKFSLARGALALMATLTLASCGGGKATFPINVSVSGVSYDGLVLTTNGQDLAINHTGTGTDPVTVNAVFPTQLEYGETYDVVPKSVVTPTTVTAADGTTSTVNITTYKYPQHQTCQQSGNYPTNLPTYGTAGQLAKIQIYYVCSINAYALSGTVKNLRGTGLTLANGSGPAPVTVAPDLDTANANAPTGKDVVLTMNPVTFNTTYGVTILSQPTGQTCTVTGGENGRGAGTMGLAAEAAGGVKDLLVNCVNNPT